MMDANDFRTLMESQGWQHAGKLMVSAGTVAIYAHNSGWEWQYRTDGLLIHDETGAQRQAPTWQEYAAKGETPAPY